MKTFEITKEQILELAELHSWTESKLKEWFTKAFKTELELGRWLKDKNHPKWLMFRDENEIYGFDTNGNWFYRINESYSTQSKDSYATDKEVETALIEEAKRRGYKDGNYKCLKNATLTRQNCDKYEYNFLQNKLFLCGDTFYVNIIFDNGKWATIIEPLTLTIDEIAEKFGTTADKIKICK